MALLKYKKGTTWKSLYVSESDIKDIEVKDDNLHLVSSDGSKKGTGVETKDLNPDDKTT